MSRLTHGDRVVFPEVDLTKADVYAYYRAIAPYLLPEIIRRPLALVRCPEGPAAKCFFQKHRTPGFGPYVYAGDDDFLSIDDIRGLLALAQMNTLEIHTWGTRVGALGVCDRMVFDLDPGPQVAWKRVATLARRLRDRLASDDLESFVRLSGGKGLHLVVPITPAPWDAVKAYARALAEELARKHPRDAVAVAAKSERNGRIFIDYLRNSRGATSVASYSLRATATATVAMPIAWRQLGKISCATVCDLRSTLDALARRRRDPWEELPRVRQSLP